MSRRTSARQEIASGSVLRHPVVYTQDGCLQHRNIASGGSKNSLERPERLNAVNLGISAIFARLEETSASTPAGSRRNSAPKVEKGQGGHDPFTIVRSTASLVTIPEHPAARDVLHIKSEEPGDMTYAETLEMWCKESRQKIVQRQREVPPEYEGDLYRRFLGDQRGSGIANVRILQYAQSPSRRSNVHLAPSVKRWTPFHSRQKLHQRCL